MVFMSNNVCIQISGNIQACFINSFNNSENTNVIFKELVFKEFMCTFRFMCTFSTKNDFVES